MVSSRPTFNNAYYLFCALFLLPAVCYCHDSFTRSRATYYGSPDCYGTPTGACGYGEYGRDVNDGYVTGVSKLYRNGAGCGACYQVKCTKPQCTEDGVNVVVTDYGEGDRTDFILSQRAYGEMSKPDKAQELFAYGVVDVEFRRVPCQYSGDNLLLKVNEHSKQPGYLAIILLYVAGQNDITAVEFWEEDRQQWTPMRRAYGAVFDLANPPSGDINVRFLVSGTNGVNWVHPNDGIPSDWEAGATYDTQIQLY
ncbi:expansin-like B1 [Punica granatum]|uniref:Expansin-like B1 n=1 Tax=Punica granatum TaxID=22663 RepID=A0A218XUQ0_PUNGR|nr:expansin-like B1 [Punica granatum]OWM88329.1 hypothetical protein CDL15_Pgr003741 [Punica granatum]